ncbi:MAG: D-alanyl-D-alanine carboxypeptidase family protein [Pseudomonadota bacterium]|nr:D-alanyl-D-alanine carboxypeptidase family protein [Pseudomonadota bacterium]
METTGTKSKNKQNDTARRLTAFLLGLISAASLGFTAPAASAAAPPARQQCSTTVILDKRQGMIVMDAKSGEVLCEGHSDIQLKPASLTKIMTLYLVFEALKSGKLKPNQRLYVSSEAESRKPTELGLKRGQMVRVDDLIRGMAIHSANDAAVVLAEALAGTEWDFATKNMNAKAKALGMKNSCFFTATGWPHDGQTTTVRDIAILSMALLNDFPELYAKYFSDKSFRYGKSLYRNTNKLLGKVDGVDGIKTGYTRSAGYNMAASAERDGRRVIVVYIGGKTSWGRFNAVRLLLDEGFATLIARKMAVRIAAEEAAKREAEIAASDAPEEVSEEAQEQLADRTSIIVQPEPAPTKDTPSDIGGKLKISPDPTITPDLHAAPLPPTETDPNTPTLLAGQSWIGCDDLFSPGQVSVRSRNIATNASPTGPIYG